MNLCGKVCREREEQLRKQIMREGRRLRRHESREKSVEDGRRSTDREMHRKESNASRRDKVVFPMVVGRVRGERRAKKGQHTFWG